MGIEFFFERCFDPFFVPAIYRNQWIFFCRKLWKLAANAEIPYLASNVAKPKVKGIDGEFFQLWIM